MNFRTVRPFFFNSLVLIALTSGCVRTVEARKPLASVNIAITRGIGGTTLTWKSVKGQVYSVQMKDKIRKDARWEFHPKGINLVGSGLEMTFTDQPPAGVTRTYRLHLLPVSGSKVGGK
jgi:hypothetical protein